MKKNSLNFSSIREEVLKEIELSDYALCSEEIYKRVNEKSQKKVSYNTVYRVLRLLEECNIVLTIQSDIKKTHYCLIEDSCNTYILENNKIISANCENSNSLLQEHGLENSNSFIVIHKK